MVAPDQVNVVACSLHREYCVQYTFAVRPSIYKITQAIYRVPFRDMQTVQQFVECLVASMYISYGILYRHKTVGCYLEVRLCPSTAILSANSLLLSTDTTPTSSQTSPPARLDIAAILPTSLVSA